MIFAKFDVDLIDHPRALEAGAVARDLWSWGLMYARKHQTDGRLPLAAVISTPWGKGGRSNVALARKLVAVGLWDEVEGGFVVRNYSAKNDTREQIDERRKAERERKASWRATRTETGGVPLVSQADVPVGQTRDETRDTRVCPGSGSGSYSDQEIGDRKDLAGGPAEPQPAWWAGALETVATTTGHRADDAAGLWLTYSGSRDRKGWPKNHGDAVGWLSDVLSRRARERRATGTNGAHHEAPRRRKLISDKDFA